MTPISSAEQTASSDDPLDQTVAGTISTSEEVHPEPIDSTPKPTADPAPESASSTEASPTVITSTPSIPSPASQTKQSKSARKRANKKKAQALKTANSADLDDSNQTVTEDGQDSSADISTGPLVDTENAELSGGADPLNPRSTSLNEGPIEPSTIFISESPNNTANATTVDPATTEVPTATEASAPVTIPIRTTSNIAPKPKRPASREAEIALAIAELELAKKTNIDTNVVETPQKTGPPQIESKESEELSKKAKVEAEKAADTSFDIPVEESTETTTDQDLISEKATKLGDALSSAVDPAVADTANKSVEGIVETLSAFSITKPDETLIVVQSEPTTDTPSNHNVDTLVEPKSETVETINENIAEPALVAVGESEENLNIIGKPDEASVDFPVEEVTKGVSGLAVQGKEETTASPITKSADTELPDAEKGPEDAITETVQVRGKKLFEKFTNEQPDKPIAKGDETTSEKPEEIPAELSEPIVVDPVVVDDSKHTSGATVKGLEPRPSSSEIAADEDKTIEPVSSKADGAQDSAKSNVEPTPEVVKKEESVMDNADEETSNEKAETPIVSGATDNKSGAADTEEAEVPMKETEQPPASDVSTNGDAEHVPTLEQKIADETKEEVSSDVKDAENASPSKLTGKGIEKELVQGHIKLAPSDELLASHGDVPNMAIEKDEDSDLEDLLNQLVSKSDGNSKEVLAKSIGSADVLADTPRVSIPSTVEADSKSTEDAGVVLPTESSEVTPDERPTASTEKTKTSVPEIYKKSTEVKEAASVDTEQPAEALNETEIPSDVTSVKVEPTSKKDAISTGTSLEIDQRDVKATTSIVKKQVEQTTEKADSSTETGSAKDAKDNDIKPAVTAAESASGDKSDQDSDESSEESSNEDSDESSSESDASSDSDGSGSESDSEEDDDDDDEEESSSEDEDEDEDDEEVFEQPEVFVYTSFSSAMINMVSHTNRMAHILQSHKIKFTYVDVATDERARRIWKWKGTAKGRVLPVVVREGEIVCDFQELEEFNEGHEVWERIIEDEVF